MAARDHFRAHARRRIELGATLRLRDSGPRQEVRIRDLGLGGAGIELPPSIDEGSPLGALERETAVTLEVMAPTLWDPLVLGGKIAWVRRSVQGKATRAGIRFEHREPSAMYALFQLLGAQVYDS